MAFAGEVTLLDSNSGQIEASPCQCPLNALAKVKELKVAGRTSSFAFNGKNQDLRLIGDMLGVQHILEGSVRKSGTKIRISAQLILVEHGFHLWSEIYDRELNDVFAIQRVLIRLSYLAVLPVIDSTIHTLHIFNYSNPDRLPCRTLEPQSCLPYPVV